MRITKKFVFGGVALSSVAAGMFISTRSQSSSNNSVQTLSSKEFNALFDQKLVDQLLRRQKQSSIAAVKNSNRTREVTPEVHVTFYRLLGCPFCAKVKSVLDASAIQYDEVIVDPLRGSGIVDPRYPLVPQLRLEAADASSSPFVVDSSSIVNAIALAYGFQKQLTDPKIHQTRAWISDRFQGVSFAALNSSWLSAFYAYPDLVPSTYRNILFRLVGATALFGLANWKVLPRLKDGGGDEAKRLMTGKNFDAWIQEEAKKFTSQLIVPKNSGGAPVFHGGTRPDLADVEMFGVMQAVARHATLGPNATSCDNELGRWFHRMEAYMADSRGSPVLQ